MLANDATTFANSGAYTRSYVNTAIANITISTISDVTLATNPPSNNSTLVYNSGNNKYVIRQMDLDGGNF